MKAGILTVMLLMFAAVGLAQITAHQTVTKENVVDPGEQQLGQRNPNAPAALSRFAFLVGRYDCNAKLKASDSKWQTFHAIWSGRFILDGYAIQDEYRMVDSSGRLVVLGMNYRSYDAARGLWSLRWLNALSGGWTDLAPPEYGAPEITEREIRYYFRSEPGAAQTFTRATYTNVSSGNFTWLGEQSEDAKSWTEFMIIDCRRT